MSTEIATETESRHSMPRSRALDGVRGAAILAVITYHATLVGPGTTPIDDFLSSIAIYGSYGVTLFFVLSGFLITRILLSARGTRGYFRTFYARRILRIFPLYYFFLIIFLVAAPLLSIRQSASGPGPIWYWLYLSNFGFAVQHDWPGSPALGATWSLAVEEQFYLLWPAVVLLCSRRALSIVCAGLVGVAIIARSAVVIAGGGPAVQSITPAQVDGLAIGALVAVAFRNPTLRSGLQRNVRKLMLAAAVAMAIILAVSHGAPTSPIFATVLAVFFGGAVVVASVGLDVVPAFSRTGCSWRLGNTATRCICFMNPFTEEWRSSSNPSSFRQCLDRQFLVNSFFSCLLAR